MILEETFTLNNSIVIPKLALGTWLCIRYVLQLGMVALPKTSNPMRMKENASVDFEIEPADMDTLNAAGGLPDYGASSFFPVFGGKL